MAIQVALVGAGAFGIKHLDGIKLIDGLEVVSLIGRDLAKTLGTYFRNIGAKATYIARYDDLFNDKEKSWMCPRWQCL
jgi:hypothetical protein